MVRKIKMWIFIHFIMTKEERKSLKEFYDLWRRL